MMRLSNTVTLSSRSASLIRIRHPHSSLVQDQLSLIFRLAHTFRAISEPQLSHLTRFRRIAMPSHSFFTVFVCLDILVLTAVSNVSSSIRVMHCKHCFSVKSIKYHSVTAVYGRHCLFTMLPFTLYRTVFRISYRLDISVIVKA